VSDALYIERASVRREHMPLTRPYTIATGSYSAVTNFVVELYAGGLVGRGIASPDPDVTRETEAMCARALEGRNWLVGQALDLPVLQVQLKERMLTTPAARAAVDIALYDLWAQAQGKPLVEALGRAQQTLPSSVTIGIKDLGETLAEVDEYLARGFCAIKIKLGIDLTQDIDRLRHVRLRCGSQIALRVDPNQGYSRAELLYFAEATAELDLELIEEPLPAGSPLLDLPDALRAQLAADESLLGQEDAQRLAGPPVQCGIFNIKLMKCGGVGPALAIAATAQRAGIKLMWGCMDESVIGISAALHAALACPHTRYLDLDGSLDLARDIACGGFIIEDGYMRTLERPGLGVEVLA
jgi:L-alanine-DL-glutamate epimerase-like enolase superfamily enzyme